MHTHEDGGINTQKAANLAKDWTFESPLTLRNNRSEDDIEMGTSRISQLRELEAEFDQLQLRTSGTQDETQQQTRPLPGETVPPTAKLHEVYNLKKG
jgi:hypothetical protein